MAVAIAAKAKGKGKKAETPVSETPPAPVKRLRRLPSSEVARVKAEMTAHDKVSRTKSQRFEKQSESEEIEEPRPKKIAPPAEDAKTQEKNKGCEKEEPEKKRKKRKTAELEEQQENHELAGTDEQQTKKKKKKSPKARSKGFLESFLMYGIPIYLKY